MLLSMTGYGRGEAQFGERRVQVEIRSVNHRFCEISMRLPRVLLSLEGRIRERVQPKLSRGKITISVTIEGQESDIGKLRLNEELTAQYLAILREMKDKFRLGGDIEISTVVGLPDVLTWQGEDGNEEAAWRQTLPALDLALEDILSMKRREGEHLAVDLLHRLDLIEAAIGRIVQQAPQMISGLRHRLENRLAEVSQDLEYKQARLETEIILFVDRADCTEECTRLRSHLAQFRELIYAPEPAGRKLNFLLQEMNRETNTIGSKAQDVPIARDVILIKEETEKIREQVQNFE